MSAEKPVLVAVTCNDDVADNVYVAVSPCTTGAGSVTPARPSDSDLSPLPSVATGDEPPDDADIATAVAWVRHRPPERRNEESIGTHRPPLLTRTGAS